MSELIVQIPLNKLSASALNVRKKDRKADVDALAASILAHGLLQNLNVIAKDEDRYEVVAGGRRLAALKSLVKAGAISRDYPVSCKVLANEQAREASLAENIQRVDMDAMDEVDAYGQVVDDGASPEDVARRFGVTLRHVQQRLALSRLSPKIKAAWKRGEVTLDAARAFCLVDDHAQQDAVFRSLGKPVTHASAVRSRVLGDRMRGNDRLAVFVGLEAYEAAGGAIVRDLFDDEAVYVGDPALMTQLAEQKLESHRETYARTGWGWIDINLTSGSIAGSRIQPEWREPTPEEETELSRLRAELDALDEAIEADSVEDDPRWDRRDELAGQVEAIRQAARVWNPELMKLAGVVLSVSYQGELNVIPGIVRPEDERAVRDLQKRRLNTEAQEQAGTEDGDALQSMPDCGLPKALIRDLSLARTRAIRFKLARDIDVSLALAVAAMIQRQRFHCAMPGVDIHAHTSRVDDFDEFYDVVSLTENALPGDTTELLPWCLAQTRETLLVVLAVITARAVDLSHERGAPADRAIRILADELCAALRMDMKEFWQPDAEFWSRLPKSELIKAMRDSPSMEDLNPTKREEQLKALGKLKKDELVTRAASAYAKDFYLPDMFVPAPVAGQFEVTSLDEQIVAA